mmetsp:Transcript_22641/g.41887  ORF Transcript_22641/g.41887 Transcript_22641/m.41887 type:complete len:425 (+) Transcript_22641:73-1347(+)
MAAFKELLGDSLCKKSANGSAETGSTEELLGGKVVGLYFSAHWCGPCRNFTPMLSEAYAMFQSLGKTFEIVFVSSDKDQSSFDEYYGSMPWLALPFSDRERKGLLSSKYGVSGIPTLVIVGEDGKTITTDGRSAVMEDPQGEQFPWHPPSLEDCLRGPYLSSAGGTEPVDEGALAGKHVGLYFSAHWCPPCKMFTPVLKGVYEKVKAAGGQFEVVFVSGCRSQEQFDEYFAEMPWLAVPYDDPRIRMLNKRFDVQGIPHLTILDPERNVLNKSAVGKVREDVEGAGFPWPPAALEDAGTTVECMGYDINERPALVVFAEYADDLLQDQAWAAALPVAEEYAAAGKAAGSQDLLFFVAKTESGITKQLRELTGTPEREDALKMIVLNIPDNGGYYVSPAEEITEAAVRDFAQNFKAGERKQLGSP